MSYSYHVLFRTEPEGGFTALVPSLPGCISYGKTLKKAQENIQEAMQLYLEELHALGETPVSDPPALLEKIEINTPNKKKKTYVAKVAA